MLLCDSDVDGDEPEMAAPLTHWYGSCRQLDQRGYSGCRKRFDQCSHSGAQTCRCLCETRKGKLVVSAMVSGGGENGGNVGAQCLATQARTLSEQVRYGVDGAS